MKKKNEFLIYHLDSDLEETGKKRIFDKQEQINEERKRVENLFEVYGFMYSFPGIPKDVINDGFKRYVDSAVRELEASAKYQGLERNARLPYPDFVVTLKRFEKGDANVKKMILDVVGSIRCSCDINERLQIIRLGVSDDNFEVQRMSLKLISMYRHTQFPDGSFGFSDEEIVNISASKINDQRLPVDLRVLGLIKLEETSPIISNEIAGELVGKGDLTSVRIVAKYVSLVNDIPSDLLKTLYTKIKNDKNLSGNLEIIGDVFSTMIWRSSEVFDLEKDWKFLHDLLLGNNAYPEIQATLLVNVWLEWFNDAGKFSERFKDVILEKINSDIPEIFGIVFKLDLQALYGCVSEDVVLDIIIDKMNSGNGKMKNVILNEAIKKLTSQSDVFLMLKLGEDNLTVDEKIILIRRSTREMFTSGIIEAELKQLLLEGINSTDEMFQTVAVEACIIFNNRYQFSEEIKKKIVQITEQHNYILYKNHSVKDEWRHEFDKDGSETVTLGKKLANKVIIRQIAATSFSYWQKAYESFQFWQSHGFDYVPIEPIVSFRRQKGDPKKMNVATRVLGMTVADYDRLKMPWREKVFEEVAKIEKYLDALGISHGHTYNINNFCLHFERKKDNPEEIDFDRPPRVYAIDFDQAVKSF